MEFHAYIDESGDEGLGGKGSRWFIIGAIVTESRKGPSLGEARKRICERINFQGPFLHWRDLSHARKLVVSEEIAKEDVMVCGVLVDTCHPKMQQATLAGGRLYFYAFRWLVERISWYVDDRGGKVRLFPERKEGIEYQDFKNYLDHVQNLPDCQIRPNSILSVKPRAKTGLPLLQLADAVAGTLYAGFEDQYGTKEPRYVLNLQNKLYRRNGKVFGYGLKFMPYESEAIPMSLIDESDWLLKI